MEGHPVGAVDCPVCGTPTRVGLPRSATIEALTARRDPDLDEAYTREAVRRKKRRQPRCPDGHLFYVYFEF